MAAHVIKVPDVGEGIAEVELVAWHVKPGDSVAEDQALADVMTDKASVEIPSPVAGRVAALGGAVGQMLAVGAELIRLETAADESIAAAPGAAARPSPAPVAVPAARPSAAAAAPRAGDAVIASPALRRRAWEQGVDLKDLPATGTAGRITQADLDAFIAARGPVTPHPASSPVLPATGVERHDQQVLPVLGLRRRIAIQMQEAKRRIPHFSYVEEVDVTNLEATRAALNAKWGEARGRLTPLPLLMRAIVLALQDHPRLNAWFDDEAGHVTQHAGVHIGVATDTKHGLLVPVVRHAEARSVWGMATELARLAEAARAGRATRAELSGSTITISSLGALGGIVSTPVINRPEVAIVGVNRIVERPMLRGGAVVSRRMMNLSSSFDHRVVDGIDAARFIQAVRELLEAPALLFADAG